MKNFKPRTRKAYRSGIRAFLKFIYPELKPKIEALEANLQELKRDKTAEEKLEETKQQIEQVYASFLERYFEELELPSRVFKDDLLLFINWLTEKQHRPPKTIALYATAAKVFFAEHGYPIPEEEWRLIRKRKLPSAKPSTEDRIPTQAELRRILDCLPTMGRALVLFLASTGCRLGEALQLKVEDLEEGEESLLDMEPPRAKIRHQYTKGGKAGRVVYMTYEARDALKTWLQARKGLKKRNGEAYEGNRVFPITEANARYMWNQALRKAGIGEERDGTTGRRKLHLHCLRKFFRSKSGLDFDTVNALMGHEAYLDEAYRRKEENEVADEYARVALKNLSIYSAPTSRKEEIKRILAMQGLTIEDIIQAFQEEIYKEGVGTGGGVAFKGPIDEDFIASLSDEEIGKYALKALRRKLLGETELNGGGKPIQKVIGIDEVEAYLGEGWRYVGAINGTKVIVERP